MKSTLADVDLVCFIEDALLCSKVFQGIFHFWDIFGSTFLQNFLLGIGAWFWAVWNFESSHHVSVVRGSDCLMKRCLSARRSSRQKLFEV